MTEQTCDRCGKPTNDDDERECESCCEALCSRFKAAADGLRYSIGGPLLEGMNTDTLCNDCEASQEEEAAFPEEGAGMVELSSVEARQ